MKPTWQRGKSVAYKSKRPKPPSLEEDATSTNEESEESQPSRNLTVTPSPAKRHRTVPSRDTPNDRNACRKCHETHNDTFWIGCGHKNRLTAEQDCDYWLHQWCVNLYFTSEEKLRGLPFFCEAHGEGKKKKSK